MRNLYTLILLFAGFATAYAGNPDRQGEAGAYELLLNPFARSAGLGSMTTANVAGAEAMRINVAGLGRANATEITLANMQYLVGTDINMNALGIAAPLGNGQTIGVTIAALAFGEIRQTTTNNPEGTGSTFSPTFFHIGIGYAKTFEERISVGFGLRFISESIFNASATGFAFDAGVQYVSGENDDFKLGISLRNIGLGMKFSGDGISEQFLEPTDERYRITGNQRVADFDLPFQLNIGVSYDVALDAERQNMITLVGNYTSNAFSRDNLGAGVEYGFRNLFMVRGGYNAELGVFPGDTEQPLVLPFSVGASGVIPFGKSKAEQSQRALIVDYAYRHTAIYSGNHNISLRLNL